MDQKKSSEVVYLVGLLVLLSLAVALFAYAIRADIAALARRHSIPFGIAASLACADIAALVTGLKRAQSRSYVAGLIVGVALLPFAAMLIAVVLYLAGIALASTPLWGSVIAVEAWLAASRLCLHRENGDVADG